MRFLRCISITSRMSFLGEGNKETRGRGRREEGRRGQRREERGEEEEARKGSGLVDAVRQGGLELVDHISEELHVADRVALDGEDEVRITKVLEEGKRRIGKGERRRGTSAISSRSISTTLRSRRASSRCQWR